MIIVFSSSSWSYLLTSQVSTFTSLPRSLYSYTFYTNLMKLVHFTYFTGSFSSQTVCRIDKISCTVYPTDIDICMNRPIIRRSQTWSGTWIYSDESCLNQCMKWEGACCGRCHDLACFCTYCSHWNTIRCQPSLISIISKVLLWVKIVFLWPVLKSNYFKIVLFKNLMPFQIRRGDQSTSEGDHLFKRPGWKILGRL